METAKRKKTRVMEIAASRLTFDDKYNRELIAARVKKLADNLDLDALGIITVSHRDDDKYVVVDGQHRVAAVLHHGFGDWKMKANVYSDLSEQEEAELFRELNDTRRITKYDDYRAGMIAKDPEWMAIDKEVRAAGLNIDRQHADGCICCVSTLQRLYQKHDDGNGRGSSLIRETLQVCIAAWGVTSASVEAKIVEGVAIVLATYGPDELDRAALVKKMAKYKGGAPGLIGSARALAEMRKGTIARMVATCVVDLYNSGRRKGVLPAL